MTAMQSFAVGEPWPYGPAQDSMIAMIDAQKSSQGRLTDRFVWTYIEIVRGATRPAARSTTMTAKLAIFFATANSIGRLRVEADLPALTGSEKQIKWATEIRDRKLVEFAREIGERQVALAMGRKPIDGLPPFDQHDDYSDIEAIVANINAKLAATGKLDKMFAQSAASFWIDNRDADPVTLGKAAQ